MAQQRSVDSLQQCIVRGLAAKPSIGAPTPNAGPSAPSQENKPMPISPTAAKADSAPVQPEEPQVPAEQPGFFGRIIAWFKGLFGG